MAGGGGLCGWRRGIFWRERDHLKKKTSPGWGWFLRRRRRPPPPALLIEFFSYHIPNLDGVPGVQIQHVNFSSRRCRSVDTSVQIGQTQLPWDEAVLSPGCSSGTCATCSRTSFFQRRESASRRTVWQATTSIVVSDRQTWDVGRLASLGCSALMSQISDVFVGG